jgi:hypothetical protein
MLTSDSKGIQKFILDRIIQINDEIVNDDPAYRELLEQLDERKKQIAAKLPPEDKKLLEDYEGSWLAQICRQEEIIYNEGLMEGMLFGYWVALVSQGIEKIIV